MAGGRPRVEGSSHTRILKFGWAYLGAVGTYIANRQPEFDPRNYGYRKLGDLIKSSGLFEIDERASPTDQGKQIYVRIKAKGR